MYLNSNIQIVFLNACLIAFVFVQPGSTSNVSTEDGYVLEGTSTETTTPVTSETEGPQLECPSNIDVLTAAKDKIQLFLPQRLHAILHLDAVQVLFVSPHNNLSVQRTVVFSKDGSVRLFVHRQELSVEPFIPKDFSPVPLDGNSINEFVDIAVGIVNKVREMDICSGYDNLNYKNAWSSCNLGKEDSNPYDETRYTETFRSTTCAMLIHHRRWRCTECSALYAPLKRRSEFLAVQEPHPCTNNNIMSEKQKLKKMEDLHRQLENEKRKNAHLRENMRKLIQKEGVPVDEATANDLNNILRDADLTEAQAIFLQEQIKASQQKNMCGMRWHPTMIRLALAIHLTSPAALELLRQSGMVQLPSSRTLFDYSHVKPVNDGIDKVVLESISKRLKDHPKHRKYHVLMADEMHISQNLVFEKSTGKMIGYTKLDELDKEIDSMNQFLDNPEKEREEKQAKKILVYMVKGISVGIKEVIATFPTDTPTVQQLYKWTWEVIGALERSGVPIIAFICDGFSTNRAFIRMHKPVTILPSGVIFDTVNKAARDRVLYFISDVPHLLKTLRNCFMNSRWDNRKSRRRMMYRGKKITWDFIIKLFETEKIKNLRKSYKLNAMNVYPDSYARMKVKYAGEVISDTVGQDLEDKNYEGSSGTIEFIRIFNKWFDCLNGAHSFVGKKKRNPNLNPYTKDVLGENPTDTRFQFLDTVLLYLKNWKNEAYNQNQNASVNISAIADATSDALEDEHSEIFQGDIDTDETPAHRRTLSRETLEGIEMSTHAIRSAITFLLNEGVEYVNARIFTQDPLEQHFSKVRGGQGGSNNPNYYQALNRNRAIHTIGQLGVKRKRGNCGESSSSMVVTHDKLPKRKCSRDAKFQL